MKLSSLEVWDARVQSDIDAFSNFKVFAPTDTQPVSDNPFRRPIRPGTLLDITFDGQSNRTVRQRDWLIANRVLNSIYERDFAFLPATQFNAKYGDFIEFYGRDVAGVSDRLRSPLEDLVFAELDGTTGISGQWTSEHLQAFYLNYTKDFAAPDHKALLDRIRGMADPRAGLIFYIIQGAADFLVESSAMGRNVLGNYGPLQSELFKIFIDECGYGVDRARHSTLYQVIMSSLGLESTPHAYWQYYLPTTLYAANYYNYISKDHRYLFRYMGALLHVETGFRVTTAQVEQLIHEIHGDAAEVAYFREHAHIDIHHASMALNSIAMKVESAFGDWALKELVLGFEQSRLIGSRQMHAMKNQLDWADGLVSSGVEDRSDGWQSAVASVSGSNHGSTVEIADRDLRLSVKRGELVVSPLWGVQRVVAAGESIVIREGTLSAIGTQEGCEYVIERRASDAHGAAVSLR